MKTNWETATSIDNIDLSELLLLANDMPVTEAVPMQHDNVPLQGNLDQSQVIEKINNTTQQQWDLTLPTFDQFQNDQLSVDSNWPNLGEPVQYDSSKYIESPMVPSMFQDLSIKSDTYHDSSVTPTSCRSGQSTPGSSFSSRSSYRSLTPTSCRSGHSTPGSIPSRSRTPAKSPYTSPYTTPPSYKSGYSTPASKPGYEICDLDKYVAVAFGHPATSLPKKYSFCQVRDSTDVSGMNDPDSENHYTMGVYAHHCVDNSAQNDSKEQKNGKQSSPRDYNTRGEDVIPFQKKRKSTPFLLMGEHHNQRNLNNVDVPKSSHSRGQQSSSQSPKYRSQSMIDASILFNPPVPPEADDTPVTRKRSVSTTDVKVPRHQRPCHKNAEFRRRKKIENYLHDVIELVPSLGGKNGRGQASVLNKTAVYLRDLKTVDADIRDEIEKLRLEVLDETKSLRDYQEKLPDSGIPVPEHKKSLDDLLQQYISESCQRNWKFWIFSCLVQPLFQTYVQAVGGSTDFSSAVTRWLTSHCSLAILRPMVSDALSRLCKKTSILTTPEKLQDEIQQRLSSHSGKSSR